MNQAEKLREEAAAMKRRATALDHVPMTDEEWGSFDDDFRPTKLVDVLNAWNESFSTMYKRSDEMRAEALYWREKYNELLKMPASSSETTG